MTTTTRPRTLRGLGAVAGVLVAAAAVIGLGVAWTVWDRYFLVQRFLWNDGVGQDRVNAAAGRTADLLLTFLAAVVVAGAAFVPWLARARANADRLCPARHRRTRGWVLWAWVCPVVNLWFPFQVVTDVWKASRPGTNRRLDGADTLRDIPGGGLVALWWACVVGGTVLGGAADLRYDPARPRIEDFHALAVAYTMAAVLLGAASVLLIMIMNQLADWQEPAAG